MRVTVILGTRPEAIKLALVIRRLKEVGISTKVCSTGQHREMLCQALADFDIKPDVNLALMEPNQSLSKFTARALESLDAFLVGDSPDLVLVHGDTTTAFCATLAAFYNHISVGHVEAGLRTRNLQSPWPEEANRVMISRLAELHFAPTYENRSNLTLEGIFPGSVIF
jgi:UDP-N-acetylglucosamine 2-epimerase (non-hydrolysing)